MMKRSVIAARALLLFAGTALATQPAYTPVAHAQAATNRADDPRNLPFMELGNTPGEMADIIAADLKRNPGGNTILVPSKCTPKAPKACATAMTLLVAFQEVEAEAIQAGKLRAVNDLRTVQDLVPYLRALEHGTVPDSGVFELFCLRKTSDGGYRAVSACVQRRLHKGEGVWISPFSRKIVMADDCKNPINGTVVEELTVQAVVCREAHFTAPPGTVSVRYEVIGEKRLEESTRCPVRLKKPGGPPQPVTDNCPSEFCTFREAELAASRAYAIATDVRSVRGSDFTTEGAHVLYLPPTIEDRQIVIICVDVKRPDGTIVHYQGKAFAGAVYDASGKVIIPPFNP